MRYQKVIIRTIGPYMKGFSGHYRALVKAGTSTLGWRRYCGVHCGPINRNSPRQSSHPIPPPEHRKTIKQPTSPFRLPIFESHRHSDATLFTTSSTQFSESRIEESSTARASTYPLEPLPWCFEILEEPWKAMHRGIRLKTLQFITGGIANRNTRSGPQGATPRSNPQTGRFSLPMQRWLKEKEMDGPFKGPQPHMTEHKDGEGETDRTHDDGESKVGQGLSLSLRLCLM